MSENGLGLKDGKSTGDIEDSQQNFAGANSLYPLGGNTSGAVNGYNAAPCPQAFLLLLI